MTAGTATWACACTCWTPGSADKQLVVLIGSDSLYLPDEDARVPVGPCIELRASARAPKRTSGDHGASTDDDSRSVDDAFAQLAALIASRPFAECGAHVADIASTAQASMPPSRHRAMHCGNNHWWKRRGRR